MKGMETYDSIETNQDGVDLAKLIHSICLLQDDENQEVMAAV